MRQTILPILAAILPFVANAAADPNAGIPEDCPELRVNPVSVPDDQNAYAFLTKLPKQPVQRDYDTKRAESFLDLHYYWLNQAKTERPTGIIIAKAKALLVRHSETLRLWDASLTAPYFVEPTVNNFSEIHAQPFADGLRYGAIREALLGNIWRIRIATHEGRHADAFNDWIHLRAALVRQADQPGTMLASMIRSVELNMVNKEAWLLHPTSSEARRCRPQSVNFPSLAYKGTIRCEARFGVVALPETDKEIDDFIGVPIYGFKEHGLKSVADYRAKVQPLLGDKITRARESRDEIRRMESGNLGDPSIFKKKLSEDSPYIRRNRATDTYFSETKIFDLIYFSRWADAISCTQADLAIALRAYAAEHEGKLPPTLDALVPVYADAVPLDPFDGKPMRYDPKIPKLWSVGPDFIDDQGPLDNPVRHTDRLGDITSWPPNRPIDQPGTPSNKISK